MIEQVEISSFDLRYEFYRMKNPRAENHLLASIIEQGILQPLRGVDSNDCPGKHILLDGFKRHRCALKVSISMVPYTSLGNDEASAIISLLKMATAKTLNILEQAKLIDDLAHIHHMTVKEISQLLEKSSGWVSMRLGMLKQMSSGILTRIFNGEFPAYSFMYTLKPFIRMKGVKRHEIEQFVDLVSGKDLSIREIALLANSYFKGSEENRHQLENGDIKWSLSQLKEISQSPGSGISTLGNLEQQMMRNLESILYLMDKIPSFCHDNRLKSPAYQAQANLCLDKILKKIEGFKYSLEELYDRTREKSSDLPTIS